MAITGKIVIETNTPVQVVVGNTRRKRLSLISTRNCFVSTSFLDATTTPFIVLSAFSPTVIEDYTGPVWASWPVIPVPLSGLVYPVADLWYFEEDYPDQPDGFVPNTGGNEPDSNGYQLLAPILNYTYLSGMASGSDPAIVGCRDFTAQFTLSGNGSYSVNPMGSLDGNSWYQLPVSPGSPNNGSDHPITASITADGLYFFCGTRVNQVQFWFNKLMTSGNTLTVIVSTA